MIVTKLGRRYAKSILDLAAERGELESVRADMEHIQGTINRSRDFRRFLQSPVINPGKKIKVLNEVFAGQLSELTFQFINIITKKGREGDLDAITEGFMQQYRAKMGIAEATVTTAFELGDAQREQIRAKLKEATGKEIQIVEKVDPSIIGGMKLRVADKEYNGSISYQLQQMSRQFDDNLYVPEF